LLPLFCLFLSFIRNQHGIRGFHLCSAFLTAVSGFLQDITLSLSCEHAENIAGFRTKRSAFAWAGLHRQVRPSQHPQILFVQELFPYVLLLLYLSNDLFIQVFRLKSCISVLHLW
jgi:hypothetical protein